MRTGCVVTLWNDVGHISGARKCLLAAIVGRVLDMGTVCAESALHHPTLTVKRRGADVVHTGTVRNHGYQHHRINRQAGVPLYQRSIPLAQTGSSSTVR